MSDIIGKPIALIQVPNQRVFTLGSAARYLGISEKFLLKISALGELPTFQFHGRRAYKLEDLNRYIEQFGPWPGTNL